MKIKKRPPVSELHRPHKLIFKIIHPPFVYIHTCVSPWCTSHTHVQILAHVYIHTYILKHARAHTHTRECMHTYIHTVRRSRRHPNPLLRFICAGVCVCM